MIKIKDAARKVIEVNGKEYELDHRAEFVAIDYDGEVWGFSYEPQCYYSNGWYFGVPEMHNDDDNDWCALITDLGECVDDWENMLFKV